MGIILDSNHIKVHVAVSTWEEAIEAAGRLLVDSGSITSQYIRHMIKAVKELGSYIVLMPGLALAHAAPCRAVIHTDLSLITLDKPVNLGSDSKQVSVILCLACVDRTNHIEKLSKLADVLMRDNIVERLAAAMDAEAVIKILR